MKTLREFIEDSYSSVPQLPLNEDFDPIPPDAKHEGFYKSTYVGPHKVQISYIKNKRMGSKYHTLVHVDGKLHKEDNSNITPENAQKIAQHVKDQHFHFLGQNLTGGRVVIAKGNSAKKTETYKAIVKHADKIAKKTGYTPSAIRSGVKFTPMPTSSSYTPPARDSYKNEPYDDSDIWKSKSKMWKFFSKKSK